MASRMSLPTLLHEYLRRDIVAMERALADLDAARAVLQERMHALRELAEDVQNLEEAR